MQTRLGTGPSPLEVKDGFVTHPRVRERAILARDYQLAIASTCMRESTAVILPTGLGKTVIAALVIAQVLPAKVLFLAPTKPLVLQHAETCGRLLRLPAAAVLTGEVSPLKRKRLFAESGVVFATPQTVLADLDAGRYFLDAALVVYDEFHHAVEDYAYVPIAARYGGLALGLSASPGAGQKKVKQILANLRLTRVESRTRESPDVAPFLQELGEERLSVELSDGMLAIRTPLRELLLSALGKLRQYGFLRYKKVEYLSKSDIIACGSMLRGALAKRRSGKLFAAMKAQGTALQASHCLELLETQGVEPLKSYFAKSAEEGKKFIALPEAAHIRSLAELYGGESHPKLAALAGMVQEQLAQPESKVLVFTQFRDTIPSIVLALGSLPGARVAHFVGQASGSVKGMRQQEQSSVLEAFRKGETNVLVCTSVGEEGLDVPSVDLVVFYEPVPSAIRAIQRRGRAGRDAPGRVVVLIAKNTRDEGILSAMERREEKMERLVGRLTKKSS